MGVDTVFRNLTMIWEPVWIFLSWNIAIVDIGMLETCS